MKIDLTGKLAIVSGSTAGIGLGISKALAESGATVVVIGATRPRSSRRWRAFASRCPVRSCVG